MSMRSSLVIVICFAAGILAGMWVPLPASFVPAEGTVYVLYALLLFVGITLGSDTQIWQALKRRSQVRLALVPVLTAMGTLVGVSAASLLLPSLGLRNALAVGAGLGYYSLSSVIITQTQGQELGVIALLSNLMREIGTLLLAPVLVHLFGSLAPIASAGATAMDSTLPIIVRCAGKEYSIAALFSGVVLTAAVPLLILMILSL
jgi:uncharacterized membrane protein YbjE (DUF340 family)